MKLHENKDLFADIINAASRSKEEGGLGILLPFIEKDYWITRSLKLMSDSDKLGKTVFKGGTSLTKGYGIGNRFSEDIDIAIAESWQMSGNQLKMLIKRTSKAMTEGLSEVPKPTTSKGSRYHKVYYAYPSIEADYPLSFINTGELLVEINSFANPYPYGKRTLTSFIYDFLVANKREDIVDDYGLQPFEVNVLDKRRTLMEKMVSLIRASLGQEWKINLTAKIRHFYDLHFLWNDSECREYIADGLFLEEFNSLLMHDREQFKEPDGWQNRSLSDSPLLNKFQEVWDVLDPVYENELAHLAYAKIPDSGSVFESVGNVLKIF